MTTITRIVAAGLASGVLSLPVLAQDPDFGPPGGVRISPAPKGLPEVSAGPGTALPGLRTPIHTAADDLGHAYGVWGAGEHYKASFHDGMTFVPYLGGEYPHNQPLSWQTVSVKVGGTELIEHGVPPQPVQQDYRYEYRFAGGVTEAYDVLAEGLEQTFVIAQLPAAGDLVITGAITSQLVADEVAPAQQALEFYDAAGRAITRYGEAIAFDATGDVVPVATGYSGGEITLTVPGAFLANATLPVVVDPLLSRVYIASFVGGGGEVTEVDVARDDEAVTDNVLIVYSRQVSATDSDVWGRLRDDDFDNGALVYTDITTNWGTTDPSCAFVGGADRWAMVFHREFGPGPNAKQVRCHVLDSGDTSFQTNYGSLIPPQYGNDWRADVGGVESFSAGDEALVVFQREDNSSSVGVFQPTATSEIHGSLLDVTTASGTFGASFTIWAAGTRDMERPAVNKVAQGGNDLDWICAFQSYTNTINADDWDVVARRVTGAGTVAPGIYFTPLGANGIQHQFAPVVAGKSGRYAIAFTSHLVALLQNKPTTVRGAQLFAHRFDWESNANGPDTSAPLMTIRDGAFRIWSVGDIAYDSNDDSHFAVGFTSSAPATPTAYAVRLGYGGGVTEDVALYSFQGNSVCGVACAFDDDNDNFQFVYGVDNGANHPVYGQVLEYTTPNPTSTFGFGCSAAVPSWYGSQQIGSEFCGVRVQNAPANAGHFMLVAIGGVDQPIVHPAVFPGCRLLVPAFGPQYLGTMAFKIGSNPTWQLSLPEWLPPMNLHFQDWVFAGNLLGSTQRLTVPIIK